jgi:hypothetical protein
MGQVGFALIMFVAGTHVLIRNGNLGPALFFVWLGASLDVRARGSHRSYPASARC